jgi:P4 family phage/plasmid primase-like protien
MTSIGDMPDLNEIAEQMEIEEEVVAPCHSHEPIPEIPLFELPEHNAISQGLHVNPFVGKFTPVWDADRFEDRFCGIVRYCHSREKYYIWNGLYWEPDERGRIRELCEALINDLIRDPVSANFVNAELLKHLVRSHTPTGIRDMMFFLEANRMVVLEDELDSDMNRINVKNGVLNLETVQCEAPDRDRFITKRMNVMYTPGATCPLWLDHLSLIFDGDQATIDSFQMISAYATLLRQNPEQIFIIAHGAGENGKTVTFGVLSYIADEYAISADPRTVEYQRESKDGSAHCSDVVRLFGSNLIIIEEGKEGGRLNEAFLKRIAGHSKITARAAYGKTEVSDYLDGKIIYLTNHMPVIKDTTHAMLRRLLKIPFNVIIPPHKRIDKYEERLYTEAPGILNWLLDGLRAWHDNNNKIKLSQKITDATTELKESTDEYREFFIEDVEITGNPKDRIAKKELFQFFETWHSDKFGEYPPMKQKEFNIICKNHGIVKDERMTAGWLWVGIKHLSSIDREDKKRVIDDNDNKRKIKALEIALAIKNGKPIEEIEKLYDDNHKEDNHCNSDISEIHIQKDSENIKKYELMNVHERSPNSLQSEHVRVESSGEVHTRSYVHNHPVDGFICSSICNEHAQTMCISDPSKCGRGVKI